MAEPIACSLSAGRMAEAIACSLSTRDMRARRAEIATVGRDGLIDATVGRSSARLLFREDARARLAAIVAAEAECCPFLALSLHDDPLGIALAIEAPPGGEATMQDLVAAFTP